MESRQEQEQNQEKPRPEIVDPTSAAGPIAAARTSDWHLTMTGRAVEELLGAFDLLAFRGTGSHAWAAPFRHDPIAFLLDTVSDAANLWAAEERKLLYQNRAAAALAVGRCDDAPVEQFVVGHRRFERRCLRFDRGGREYILEIIHEVSASGSAATSAESVHGQ